MEDGEPLPAGQRERRLSGGSRSSRRRRPGARIPGSDGPGAPSPVAVRHRRRLEALIDLLRVALELETRCDFGDGPNASGPGRIAFFAHFDGWRDALEDWEERARAARAAPAALWASFDEAARGMGLPEPPLAVGALVDRLATFTVQRSREGRLAVPHALHLQSLRSGYGERSRTTVYVEGQSVALLRGDDRALAEEIERRIQQLFDAVQRTDAALEVGRATDAVLEAKEILLGRLNVLAASDSIAFAPDCPVCAAQAAKPAGPARSSAL